MAGPRPVSLGAEQLGKKILSLVKNHRDGMGWTELWEAVHKQHPGVPLGTFSTAMNSYVSSDPTVWKPSRGRYQLVEFREPDKAAKPKTAARSPKKEEEFYQPFADYLVGDLEECTKAIRLGGKHFGDKWGSPDVIGVFKSNDTDIFTPPEKVITAVEIKTDPQGVWTGFGQACSYRLFSHKVWLAVPKSTDKGDIDRLEALCNMFGIGFVLFDAANPKEPNWEMKNRAQKGEPDYFYLNANAKRAIDFFKDLLR